jgi:excinuclease ABC subunit A
MSLDKITIKGAKEHNLKNISLEIPRDKMVIITGLSGSGKSSLAFDTIYAEGQRRYVESLSTYARQFLELMEKPDVDSIEGLSPAIAIDQKSSSRNPRSTVGTVTEIYDYLRLLYAKLGTPHCPDCKIPVKRQTAQEIMDIVMRMEQGKKIMIMSPMVKDRKGEHIHIFEQIQKSGFVRMRVDGEIKSIIDEIVLDKNKRHTIEVVVDRLIVSGDYSKEDRTRLADSIETALKLGEGVMSIIDSESKKEEIFSEHFACDSCGKNLPEITPRSFSFNSPHGACECCHGLGVKKEVDPSLVIPNKNLTLAEGAILPWAKTSNRLSWYNKLLEAVSKDHDFSVDVPVRELTDSQINIVLYGTGEKKYPIEMDGRTYSGSYMSSYEGVIPNLERRYMETDSDYIRTEIEKFMTELPCPVCNGKRLKEEILSVLFREKSIIDITELSLIKCFEFFDALNITSYEEKVGKLIFKEIRDRLKFLNDVGLSYLTLSRGAGTLSGGEAQRIRLATQIGSQLMGVLYVLDEPSIGLHQRDNDRLIATLKRLRDIGNTVIVVEHDEETMMSADYIIDMGPGAGKHGGEIIAEGTIDQIKANKNSITGAYLCGDRAISIPLIRRKGSGQTVKIVGARHNNLKNISVEIPLGKFIGISGISGSGKSTLINEILVKALSRDLNGAKTHPGKHDEILGKENLDKIINIDQKPIGRTPRSNPATYTSVFTDVRDLFSGTPEARIRGYGPGRFSFNVKGGRCESCKGDGMKKIEMHFLADIYVTCEECKGKRYNRESLEVMYKGKDISEVLDMTIREAMQFFSNIPKLKEKLSIIDRVGLGYIHLGQPATTLSGGEAQRIKLATELMRRSTGKTIYVLDEPTTGLHFADIDKLLGVLNELVDSGNTVITIEHNLDVLKTVDWIIDLGPEGGDKGGMVVAEGAPEEITKVKKSYTGQYLKKLLNK